MKRYFLLILLIVTASAFSLPTRASVVWDLNNFFLDGCYQDYSFHCSGGEVLTASAIGQFEWDDVGHSIVAWHIEVFPVFFDSPGVYSDNSGSAFLHPIGFGDDDLLIFLEYIDGRRWDFRIGLDSFSLLDTPSAYLPLGNGATLVPATGFLECANCGPWRGGISNAFLSSGIYVPAYTYTPYTPPNTVETPIPNTLALLVLGLVSLGFIRRKRI
jgi:hypothetical protein